MSTEGTVIGQMEFPTIEEHTVPVVPPPPTDAPNAGITPVAPNPGITSVAPNPGITPVSTNAEITNAGIKQEFIESKEQNEGPTILSDEVVLELTEEFLTEILKTVDDLCNKIKNGDPDLERTLEVNQILNYGVNCYRQVKLLVQNFITRWHILMRGHSVITYVKKRGRWYHHV